MKTGSFDTVECRAEQNGKTLKMSDWIKSK